MMQIAVIVLAAIAGLLTFLGISRKMGADCLP